MLFNNISGDENIISLQNKDLDKNNIQDSYKKKCVERFNYFGLQKDNFHENQIKTNFTCKKVKFNINNFLSNENKIFKIEPKKNLFKVKTGKVYRWSQEENWRFLQAVYIYGKNWKKIQKYVKSRSLIQVRSHSQKFVKKMKKFKDLSLGLDFTEQSIETVDDIINKIKEYEKNKSFNYEILILIFNKLFNLNSKKKKRDLNIKIEKYLLHNYELEKEQKQSILSLNNCVNYKNCEKEKISDKSNKYNEQIINNILNDEKEKFDFNIIRSLNNYSKLYDITDESINSNILSLNEIYYSIDNNLNL